MKVKKPPQIRQQTSQSKKKLIPESEKWKFIHRFIRFYVFVKFITDGTGSEYRVSHFQKLKLVFRLLKLHIGTPLFLSQTLVHLVLIKEILSIPKSLQGDVVECGCCHGRSTISLSWACALTGRRLLVCDSFGGLPEPHPDESITVIAYSDWVFFWEKGLIASLGGLEGVKKRLNKFGNIEVCQFVKGYFQDTLPHLATDSIVMVFEDADLPSSVECCLRHLWPKLKDNCKFFSHEPWSIPVVSLFFDKAWWKKEFNCEPPGFCGSLKGIVPGLGFAKKVDVEKILKYGRKFRWM